MTSWYVLEPDATCGAGNDICKEAKRQIISADDVLAALDDVEFSDFLPSLRDALEGVYPRSSERPSPDFSFCSSAGCGALTVHAGFRAENKEKVKRRAAQQKKRKLDSAVPTGEGEGVLNFTAAQEQEAQQGTGQQQEPAG